jgi:polysaccharide pyruvyl transferase WcaK-like protein
VKRIIVETGLGKGIEEYGNMGDISMLQVAVDRLRFLLPDARIEVLTDSAENLLRFCPAAVPLDNRGRTLWFSNAVLPESLRKLTPQWGINLLVQLKRMIRSQYPDRLKAMLVKRCERRNRQKDAESVATFTNALDEASLVFICGAGGFYDGCRSWNHDILDLVEAALERKRPVAMFGQGFGPISDPDVLKRASKILPQVELITLRGGRNSHELLRKIGVSESKMETTGDEALELAYASRSSECGRALGINIRFLASAWTDEKDVQIIRPILHEFARRHNVPLIPLPIAIHLGTRDDLAIRELLAGFDEESDGGRSLDSPDKVIKQVGGCRVIVTGAYHAAVFALGQGVPVVALAKSEYFCMKMLGLQDQFGAACQTVLLNEPDWPLTLKAALDNAWLNAEDMRQTMQAVTAGQIELSRKSYGRIKGLLAGAGKATAV